MGSFAGTNHGAERKSIVNEMTAEAQAAGISPPAGYKRLYIDLLL